MTASLSQLPGAAGFQHDRLGMGQNKATWLLALPDRDMPKGPLRQRTLAVALQGEILKNLFPLGLRAEKGHDADMASGRWGPLVTWRVTS